MYKAFLHAFGSVGSAVKGLKVNSASLLTSPLRCCHGEKSSWETGLETLLKGHKIVSGPETSCLLGVEIHPV